MVQLLIYPSFAHYQLKDLITWHRKYTKRLSLIVIPLMFAQVGIVSIQLINNQNVYEILSGILVTLVWISTFTQFVPLHQKISKGVAPIARKRSSIFS